MRRGGLGSPARVFLLPHDMKLHPVQDGVIVDGPGVCGASAKGLNVGLSGPSKILVRDRRERQQVDLVDLDQHGTAPVDTSDLDLWSRPEAVRDRDGSVRYSTAKVRAEPHAAILSSLADVLAVAVRKRGVKDPEARLTAEAGIAGFKIAFDRWAIDPKRRDHAHLVRESLEALKAVTAGKSPRRN